MTGSQQDHGHRAHVVAMGRAPRRRRLMHGFAGWRWNDLRRRTLVLIRSRFMLRMLLGSAICFAVVMIAALGLWWRLSSGPIELNLATPWLKAAIEENFGGNHSVAVGGTQLERDEKGRTSLRLRDIVVRDADGTVVASAPKAEVGLSGRSLLMGKLRAQVLTSSAPKCRFGSKPMGASPYSLAPTNGQLRLPSRQSRRSYCRAQANRVLLLPLRCARNSKVLLH